MPATAGRIATGEWSRATTSRRKACYTKKAGGEDYFAVSSKNAGNTQARGKAKTPAKNRTPATSWAAEIHGRRRLFAGNSRGPTTVKEPVAAQMPSIAKPQQEQG
jgi:hypothetical protein